MSPWLKTEQWPGPLGRKGPGHLGQRTSVCPLGWGGRLLGWDDALPLIYVLTTSIRREAARRPECDARPSRRAWYRTPRRARAWRTVWKRGCRSDPPTRKTCCFLPSPPTTERVERSTGPPPRCAPTSGSTSAYWRIGPQIPAARPCLGPRSRTLPG